MCGDPGPRIAWIAVIVDKLSDEEDPSLHQAAARRRPLERFMPWLIHTAYPVKGDGLRLEHLLEVALCVCTLEKTIRVTKAQATQRALGPGRATPRKRPFDALRGAKVCASGSTPFRR